MGPFIRGIAVLCIAAMIRECAASSEDTAEDSPIGHAAPDFMRIGISSSSTECHVQHTELERALQDADELERQLVAMQVRLPGRVVQLWQTDLSPGTDVAVTEPSREADGQMWQGRVCSGVHAAYCMLMMHACRGLMSKPPASRSLASAALQRQCTLQQHCRVTTPMPRCNRNAALQQQCHLAAATPPCSSNATLQR